MDRLHKSEERLKSFKYWPYKQGPCNPQKLAEAGFYAIGGKSEPDLVQCYVCLKELDGWEREDDPWNEHKKHAPACPYVLLNKKPAELTTKEVITLANESVKKKYMVAYEKKLKILEEMKDAVLSELEKINMKSGKENRKRKPTRATSKRTSRKD